MMKMAYILIGPKGSGKSYIGQLLQRNEGIPFLRVEDIWLTIERRPDDTNYISEGFNQVEKEIRRQFQTIDHLIIESTAVVSAFDKMVQNLKNDFIVKLIRVDADSQLCLQRIKMRDKKMHIPVSEEMIFKINNLVAQKKYAFDYVISNNYKSDKDILNEWSKFMHHPE